MVKAVFRVEDRVEVRGSMDQPRMDLSLRNTDSGHLIPAPAVTQALSEALIMEELRKGFPLAVNRASAAEVSTVVEVEVFTVAEATGNPV